MCSGLRSTARTYPCRSSGALDESPWTRWWWAHQGRTDWGLRLSSLLRSTKCPLPGRTGSHLVGHLRKVEAWIHEGDHVTSRPWMLHRFESGEVHGSSWCTPTCFPIHWCTLMCKTQELCDCSEMPVGQRSSCRWCTCPRIFWLRCWALPGSWSVPGAGGTVWLPPPPTDWMAPYLSSRLRPPRSGWSQSHATCWPWCRAGCWWSGHTPCT